MGIVLERLANPPKAAEYLAKQLRKNSLGLLLGAGFSAPLGVPTFRGLVDECLRASKADPLKKGEDPELAAVRVWTGVKRNRTRYLSVVKRCLYPKGAVATRTFAVNPRLTAVGALMTGSRRGSVRTVVTLNYDSLLEEYLSLHGVVTETITDLPQLTGVGDVVIYHPHGLIPMRALHGLRSTDVILTRDEMNRRYGSDENQWNQLLRHLVRTNVLVAIGVSPNTAFSQALGGVLATEAEKLPDDRPVGFWLLGQKRLTETEYELFRSQRIVPVLLKNHKSIDGFLLDVCQQAATLARVAD